MLWRMISVSSSSDREKALRMSARLTMPTTRPALRTGNRLILCSNMRRAISWTVAASATVTTGEVMISSARNPSALRARSTASAVPGRWRRRATGAGWCGFGRISL